MYGWLDKTIRLLLVSPDMHKFHHHHQRPWTDINFANSFSIWDRLFGTLVYDDIIKIKYGINILDECMDENIGYQIKLPFDCSIKVTMPEMELQKEM